MRHENGAKLLGVNDPRYNDIGIIHVSPEDEKRALLTALLAENKLRRKQIVIVLPDPNKAVQRSTDFDHLKTLQSGIKGVFIFVIRSGSRLAEMAQRHDFPVYSSLKEYAEAFHQEQIDEQNKRIGQRFGHYKLIRLLGQGGFATVYLAQHLSIRQQVAIKVLSAVLTPEAKEEFRTEAQTLAALDHPHIVPLLDFALASGVPFLVMKYASGGTLRDRHPKGERVPIETVIAYVKQIAEAVQFAHEKQIIHRDLKPENLLLDQRGEILVSDFGMATLSESLQITPETIGGTPIYMAPEQFDGRPKPASDQYALGVMVYEWLSGTPPFRGTPQELFNQHRVALPTPLRTILPELPFAVEQVILVALAKEPEERYENTLEFASALERAATRLSSIDTETPPGYLDTLYQEGVLARADGDLEQAIQLWQQVLDRDPRFRHGLLGSQMKQVKEEWHTLQVKTLREDALWAHADGQWDQEIAAWTQLLKLESHDQQAKDYLKLAQQHQPYLPIYQGVELLLESGNGTAAKQQLLDLWQRDPYYGDPLDLAKQVHLQVPRSYEQEQADLEKAQQRREQMQRRRRFMRSVYGPLFGKPWIVRVICFCLLSGIGATIGLFSREWLWASGIVIAAAACASWSGYRRLLSTRHLLGITLLCVVVTTLLTLMVSTWSYNEPHPVPYTDYQWNNSLGYMAPYTAYHQIFLGRQVTFGFVFGLLGPLLYAGARSYVGRKFDLPHISLLGFFILSGAAAVVSGLVFLALGALGAANGYGFDFGGYAIIPGILVGIAVGTGITASFPLWRRIWADA